MVPALAALPSAPLTFGVAAKANVIQPVITSIRLLVFMVLSLCLMAEAESEVRVVTDRGLDSQGDRVREGFSGRITLFAKCAT